MAVDLNGILTNIQSLLQTNNTTTSTVVDLSNGLETRLRQNAIMKIHPQMIRPGADLVPFVTCYIVKKEMEDGTIAKNKLSIQRQATVSLEIVGAVWNDDYNSVNQDPADAEIHTLMENIEHILRSDDTLSSVVKWHVPRECSYYDQRIDEEAHLRTGFLRIEAKVFY